MECRLLSHIVDSAVHSLNGGIGDGESDISDIHADDVGIGVSLAVLAEASSDGGEEIRLGEFFEIIVNFHDWKVFC